MAELVKTFPVTTRGVGLPDYSTAAPVGQVPVGAGKVYSSSDIGELAARMGSPIVFDRRGNVFWYDNFVNGTQGWEFSATHGNLAVGMGHFGPQSLKIFTDAVIDNAVIIQQRITYPTQSKIGSAVCFTIPVNLACRIRIAVVLFTETSYNAFDIFIDASKHVTYSPCELYIGIAGTPTTKFGTLSLPAHDPLSFAFLPFNVAKVVADPVTGAYTRFILNGTEFDLSSYMGDSGAIAFSQVLDLTFQLITREAISAVSYVDYVAFTQNEPDNA